MSTTTTYEVLGTTDDHTDCGLCGRSDLKGTIALAVVEAGEKTGEVVYYGSDCGARAAGWGTGGARRMRAAAEAADRAADREAEMLAERRARYGRALGTLSLNDEISSGPHAVAELGMIRRTFHQMGGMHALGPFPAWVARVAETGEL